MATSIDIQGVEELVEKLENAVDIDTIVKAVGKACALVERSAKQKAVKGTGELRNSITSKVTTEGNDVIGSVFTPVEYAPYVEFGTGLFAENGNGRKEVPWVYVEGSTRSSNKKTVYATPQDAEEAAAYLREEKGLDAVVTYGMKPQPFLRPALNENREKIKRIIGEGMLND